MIQLNNEREIQAWVQFAAAFNSGEMSPEQEAEYAARYADAKVLELRQRISNTPENQESSKDTDGWETFPNARWRRKIDGKWLYKPYLLYGDNDSEWEPRPEGV